ncbi:hypothetical protein LX36DRAFT_714133 [Colletotrichum falcatum]|nr:hypothetical protein LX36DRAFT_714133 [Colletotrichum falcatum]
MSLPEVSRPVAAHAGDGRLTASPRPQTLSTPPPPSHPPSPLCGRGTPNSWRSRGEWDACSAATGGQATTPRTSVSYGNQKPKTGGASGLGRDDGPAEKPPPSERVTDYGWPVLPDPPSPNTKLTPRQLTSQRAAFILAVSVLNLALAAVACFGNTGLVVFVFILFFKSRDFLSSAVSLVCLAGTSARRRLRPPAPVSRRWILSLIPAYSESEEQLIKTVYSLRDNGCGPHRQVNVRRTGGGELRITAGFMRDAPVIVIEKVRNGGKKDSLYAFGQFVRRRAEGFVGKVTCLPGCVTMVAVRKEMTGAISKNLGTDRRLTYCMLSQGRGLRTIPSCPAPSPRRWRPSRSGTTSTSAGGGGSNAYFNNYFYCAGDNMALVTRAAAAVDVARQTLVYYRVLNTVLFVRALAGAFSIRDVLPLVVVGQFPVVWFLVCLAAEPPPLRRRAHKILLGFLINQLVSPFMSIVVFSAVAMNLGNAVWGMSGVTASSAPAAPVEDGLSKAQEGKAGVRQPRSPAPRPPSPPQVL